MFCLHRVSGFAGPGPRQPAAENAETGAQFQKLFYCFCRFLWLFCFFFFWLAPCLCFACSAVFRGEWRRQGFKFLVGKNGKVEGACPVVPLGMNMLPKNMKTSWRSNTKAMHKLWFRKINIEVMLDTFAGNTLQQR